MTKPNLNVVPSERPGAGTFNKGPLMDVTKGMLRLREVLGPALNRAGRTRVLIDGAVRRDQVPALVGDMIATARENLLAAQILEAELRRAEAEDAQA